MKKSLWVLIAAALAVYGCADGGGSDEPVCGNGTVESGEACDDGNLANGDGCSSACLIEGNHNPVCGNGTVESGEGCDDGNTVNGDGCSEDCKIETASAECGNGTVESGEGCDDGNLVDGDGCSSKCEVEASKAECGNGVLEPGEECDKEAGVPSSCSVWKPSAAWSDGTAKPACSSTCTVEVGACVLSTCGNGVMDADEACDGSIGEATCETFDGSKTWVSGEPVCSKTTCQLEVGSCVEQKCGNGVLDEGEACDPGAPKLACSDYNSSYVSGTTKCTSECQVDATGCVAGEAPVCGNGKLEAGEACDWGKENGESRNCSDVVPGATTGKATCNGCVLDTSACAGSESGFYWCQLMDPIEVTFDETKKTEVMVAHYGVGDDITETAMAGKLVYGKELHAMDTWKTVAATQDVNTHSFKATLTSSALSALVSDGTKVYYTFAIQSDGDADPRYCRRNVTGNDPAVDNPKLSPVLYDSEDKTTHPTEHDVGFAVNSKVASSDIVAKFTFERAKFDDGSAKTYTADVGSGLLSGSGFQCVSGCFSGADKALNVQNWKKAKADALSSGAYLLISELPTTGLSGIRLDMDVWRNASESAKNIVVLYSTDKGANFTEYGDIPLDTDEEKLKKFISYDVTFPSAANNVSELQIKLVPYGSNGALRFDNVVVSQGN